MNDFIRRHWNRVLSFLHFMVILPIIGAIYGLFIGQSYTAFIDSTVALVWLFNLHMFHKLYPEE